MTEISSWPHKTPIAVVINVMYEMWSPGTAPGLGPMGNPLGAGALDYQALSWSGYGPRTGIGRLLDLLERSGVRASVYASGILAEEAPRTIAAIVDGGHELYGHAWSQDVLFPKLDEGAERADIERTTAALAAAGGVRPHGWISPRCTPSARTPELLAAAGYRWFGDVFDAEEPYLLQTAAGPIAALPFGLEVNDLPLLVRYGAPARELLTSFEELLAAVRGEHRPAHLDVTVHAHVAARPTGLHALAQILERAHGAEDCFFATRGEVVRLALGEELSSDRR